MNPTGDLAALQAQFWQAVRSHQPPAGLNEVFVSRGELSATRRMEIYHAAYWARHEQCLKDSYPRVLAELGEQAFHALVAQYIQDNPSVTPCIEWAGQALPAYLRERAACSGHAHFVADLALLEWSRIAALMAPDTTSELARSELTAADVTTQPLCTAPSLRLVRVHPDALARLRQPERPEPAELRPSAAVVWVAVWRRELRVHMLELADDHGRALEQACQGATLARACAEFDDPGAAERAAVAVGQWLARGWLVGGQRGQGCVQAAR